MSTEMSLECSSETIGSVYLDVVDGMNVLHRFLDDLTRLKESERRRGREKIDKPLYLPDTLMRTNNGDCVPMDKNVTIGEQFNGLDRQRRSVILFTCGCLL